MTLKILSSHAADEEYIDREEHSYIKVQRLKAPYRLRSNFEKPIIIGLCARQSCAAASCALDVTPGLEQLSLLLLSLLLVRNLLVTNAFGVFLYLFMDSCGEPNHGSAVSVKLLALQDPAAVHLHKQFVEALNSAENEMDARNKTGGRLQQGRGMPYTLLMPSNPQSEALPGTRPAGRGVPYSVSI